MSALLPSFQGMPRPVLALLGATFVDRVGTFVVTFLALYLTSERGLSVADAGVIASLWGGGSLVGSPIGGYLADTIGRKKTLLIGYAAVACALLGLSAVADFRAIGALTFVVGVASALHRPACAAALADLVEEKDRARAFALFYWVVNLAFSVSPVLGSVLVKQGFSTLFVVDAASSVACAVLIARLVPETGGARGEVQRAASPLVPLRDRAFWPFLLLSLLVAVVFHQIDVTLPVDARAHDVDLSWWGLLLAINGVMIVLVQPALNRRAERWSIAVVCGGGSFFVGLGFALHGIWTTLPGYALGIVCWTLGEILWAPATPLVATKLAPKELRGTYLGVANVPHGVGFLLGPLIGSRLLEPLGPALWWSCGVAGVVGVGLSIWLERLWRATATRAVDGRG